MSAVEMLLGLAGTKQELYVDDVFSAWRYTGNGATQAINNGINLAEGGLVWTKYRGALDHCLVDSVRGIGKMLVLNSTVAQTTSSDIASFNANGYTLSASASQATFNWSGYLYSSYTFKKAPRFFDVVKVTLGGNSNRRIPHNLGVVPGLIIARAVSASNNWFVYHRSTGPGSCLVLNNNDPSISVTLFGFPAQTATEFGLNEPAFGVVGGEAIAYLFAHDVAQDGVIQCDSFTTSAGGSANVVLGWEPQFVLYKTIDSTGNWYVEDTCNALNSVSGGNAISANSAEAEAGQQGKIRINATGFTITTGSASANYLFLAVRRQSKPVVSGLQVFKPLVRTGNGAMTPITGIGFAPDIVAGKGFIFDRLLGRTRMQNFASAQVEANISNISQDITSFDVDGVTVGEASGTINSSGVSKVSWYLRRAPGFLDVVSYTGSNNAEINHNLKAAPEFIVIRNRKTSAGWIVYHKSIGLTQYLDMAATNPPNNSPQLFLGVTSRAMNLLTDTRVNGMGHEYIAYLFATCPGVSKVGNYGGNGGSQVIDCGFASGARFILLKRIDYHSDWYIFDSARGITAAGDPAIAINTYNGRDLGDEDVVGPHPSGFVVNQSAQANMNSPGASYIYFAIA